MIRKQVLTNGLTLLGESMPHVRSVTLGVWLKRGSRHEPAAVNGISHLLEHMVFKGTATRSARDIALAVESIGGQMDAFTSKEYTCFYLKVLDRHLEDALEILADIVRRPRFDPEELERERRVILEEIRMVEDTPDELVYDLFAEHVHPGNALGRSIQGTAHSVGRVDRATLSRYFRAAYRPENVILAAAGSLKHDRLAKLVERFFGSMERGRRQVRRLPRPRWRGGIVKRAKALEQVHVVLGFKAYPRDVEHRFPVAVLNALLGGMMSSRLFQKIREERGLAYAVYSGVQSFLDSGYLTVYAATAAEQVGETVALTVGELRALRLAGPTPEEVANAKEHLKGSLMLSLESTSSRMTNLAQQQIYYGRSFELREILDGIERVDRDRVHGVCRDLFGGAAPALAVVGKIGRFRANPAAIAP